MAKINYNGNVKRQKSMEKHQTFPLFSIRSLMRCTRTDGFFSSSTKYYHGHNVRSSVFGGGTETKMYRELYENECFYSRYDCLVKPPRLSGTPPVEGNASKEIWC